MRPILILMTTALLLPFTSGPAIAPPSAGCSRVDQFASTGAAIFSPTPLLNSLLGTNLDVDLPILIKLDKGSGQTAICLGDPIPEQPDCFFPEPTCTYTIPTEMVQLDLKGDLLNGLATVRIDESEIAHSTGAVTGARFDPQLNAFHGGKSFFDVYYDMTITTLAGTIVRGTNCVAVGSGQCKAFRVESDLDTPDTYLPPVANNARPYTHPSGDHSVVWDTNGRPLGELIAGCHKPFQRNTPGHRICLLASGKSTDDGTGTGTSCVHNSVQFGVLDVSGPPHTIAGVASAATGVTMTPWTSTTMNGENVWTSSANTGAVPCSPATLTVVATFTDTHASAPVTTKWMQHH